MDIHKIHPEQTYHLRHAILRPHQDFSACQYETDYDNDAFHLGVFEKGELISIGSFYSESIPGYEGESQYRLRAMATDDFC